MTDREIINSYIGGIDQPSQPTFEQTETIRIKQPQRAAEALAAFSCSIDFDTFSD